MEISELYGVWITFSGSNLSYLLTLTSDSNGSLRTVGVHEDSTEPFTWMFSVPKRLEFIPKTESFESDLLRHKTFVCAIEHVVQAGNPITVLTLKAWVEGGCYRGKSLDIEWKPHWTEFRFWLKKTKGQIGMAHS